MLLYPSVIRWCVLVLRTSERARESERESVCVLYGVSMGKREARRISVHEP